MKQTLFQNMLNAAGAFLFAVTLSAGFTACVEKIDNPVTPIEPGGDITKNGDYNYLERVASGVDSRIVIIGSIQGDVTNIKSSENWMTAEQIGNDGANCPIIKLKFTGGSPEERTGYVTFNSSDNKLVSITVKQKAIPKTNEDADVLPEVASINKDFYIDWFKGVESDSSWNKVYITENESSNTWKFRNLPWASTALGSIPFSIINEMKTTKDDWILVYSTMGLSSTAGANFFTLYNPTLAKLRFFYWIPSGSIQLASSASFSLDLSSPSVALSSNETYAVPDSVLSRLPNNYTQSFDVVPFGTDDSRCITSGWACFDMTLTNGYMTTANESLESPNTMMKLQLNTTVQENIQMLANLSTSGDLDMSDVTLVKPSNKLKVATSVLNGLSDACSKIGSGIATIDPDNPAKVAGGVVQIVGGGLSVAGTITDALAESQSTQMAFNGSAKLDLATTGNLDGSLTFNTVNGIPAVTFYPNHFKYKWETLFDDTPEKWTSTTNPIFGVMNLTKSPVVYVSADHLLYNKGKYPSFYQVDYDGELIRRDTNEEEDLRFISFLDPSSIEAYINKEMMGYQFDSAQINVSLVTCFDGAYEEPDPYIGLYGLENDAIQLSEHDGNYGDNIFEDGDTKSMKLVDCPNKKIPTITKGSEVKAEFKVTKQNCTDKSDIIDNSFNYRFYGLTSQLYDKTIVVDPIIYVPTDNNNLYYNKSHLGQLYVVVSAILTKNSDDSKQFITRHFLPEVRTFKTSDISSIKRRINNYNPSTVKTITGTTSATYPDNTWLKERALKMLELAGQ